MKDTPIIDSAWLKTHLDDSNLLLIDVSPKSNKSGLETSITSVRIPGARYFDLKNGFSDQSNPLPNMLPSPVQFQKAAQKLGINKSSKIVVYDNLGIYASPRVWWMFKTMGHDSIFVLDGGLPAWISEGNPTDPISETRYSQGNFEAKLNPNSVFDFDGIKSNIESKDALVIDARSAGRFAGTSPEPREGLSSGHIAHSINIPFARVLKDGKMKSASELEDVFKDIGSAQTLVFSCGSGLTACIVLLASELVRKNQKAVYDGSWTEWAQRAKD